MNKRVKEKEPWPTRAVILAAGFGTRMLPLSHQCPKALVPLWNKPMLQHTLDMLTSWGVNDVLINMHHLPQAILSFIREYPSSIRIELSYEPDILGTGGALQKAAWFIQQDDFWMVNADIAAALDPTPIIRLHRTNNVLSTLWLHPEKGPRTVEMEHHSIHTFRSKRPGTPGTYTFCGLQLLSPSILSFLPPEGFSSIITGYEKAMQKGHCIAGTTVSESYWADIGTPEQYLKAHEEIQTAYKQQLPGKHLYTPLTQAAQHRFKQKRIHIHGFSAIDTTVQINGPAHLTNCVIWPESTIKPRAHLTDCIVGQHTTASGHCEHVVAPTEIMLNPTEMNALRRMGITPGPNLTCDQQPARGSARSFFRISDQHLKTILIRYSLERKENGLYARHTRLLQSIGCHVPTIYYEDRKNRFMLMEDIGTRSFETWVPDKAPRTILQAYQKAIDQVICMHTKGVTALQHKRATLMPAFDIKLYQWEHDLFITHFLSEKDRLNNSTIRMLKNELSLLPRILSQRTPVLIHRDLQSSNLYHYKREVYLIDYQGMRKGSAAYDLASLLCDPYVMLPIDMQKKLLTYYIQATGNNHLTNEFWYAAIQRLLQAIGAYGRLSKLSGAERFKRYIPSAVTQLLRALDHVSEPFTVLRALIRSDSR